jgi:hypothetical protein
LRQWFSTCQDGLRLFCQNLSLRTTLRTGYLS